MRTNHEGICRLCGRYTKMSFEHIPPQKAFNDQQKLFQTMLDMLNNRPHSRFRKGMGLHSLCEQCNNLTGSWYGGAFVRWTQQGMEWLDKLGAEPSISIPFHIKPLNVIKQILVMAIALSSEKTLTYHDELRRFLLNKEQNYLPPKYNVHVYFNRDGKPRFASDMVIANVKTGGGNYVEAEVALPPFGYCVTKPVRGMQSLATQQKLYDISWFADYAYNVWIPVYLRLPLRETHEPMPLDYRTHKEVEEHHERMGINKPSRKAK